MSTLRIVPRLVKMMNNYSVFRLYYMEQVDFKKWRLPRWALPNHKPLKRCFLQLVAEEVVGEIRNKRRKPCTTAGLQMEGGSPERPCEYQAHLNLVFSYGTGSRIPIDPGLVSDLKNYKLIDVCCFKLLSTV